MENLEGSSSATSVSSSESYDDHFDPENGGALLRPLVYRSRSFERNSETTLITAATSAQISPGLSPGPRITNTHNTSNAHCHIEVSDLVADVDRAIRGAWETRHIEYLKVFVLLISWEENDMPGLETEIQRLRSVFEDAYFYSVDSWKIPSKNPDLATLAKVQSFVQENGEPRNLLIVYYGGHAREGSNMGPIWRPRARPEKGREVNTAGIHTILCRAQDDSPDVLLLYDCCNPTYVPEVESQETRAVVECLFAGGFESRAPTAGPDSFTAALINELSVAITERKPLSVPNLHRRLITRLRGEQKYAIFKNNRLRQDEDGHPLLTKQVRVTPQHFFLSAGRNPRPINLVSFKNEQFDKVEETDSLNWPKVLIAVRLEQENTNRAIEKWLLSAPPDVKYIGMFPSYSTLLLLQISVEIWDLLLPSTAISFVGFITGPFHLHLSAIFNHEHFPARKTWNYAANDSEQVVGNTSESGTLSGRQRMSPPPRTEAEVDDATDRHIDGTEFTSETHNDTIEPDGDQNESILSLLQTADRIFDKFEHIVESTRSSDSVTRHDITQNLVQRFANILDFAPEYHSYINWDPNLTSFKRRIKGLEQEFRDQEHSNYAEIVDLRRLVEKSNDIALQWKRKYDGCKTSYDKIKQHLFNCNAQIQRKNETIEIQDETICRLRELLERYRGW